MGIFEQYGIRDVANVTLYSIKKNQNGDLKHVPVLFLDTLKLFTSEKTAQEVYATGGQGNSQLIGWDFGKEIKLNIEDALFTPASMSLIWGGKFDANNQSIPVDLVNQSLVSTKALITINEILDYTTDPVNGDTWVTNSEVYFNNGEKELITFTINYKENSEPAWTATPITISAQTYNVSFLSPELLSPSSIGFNLSTAINNVYFLERMEKIVAKKQFAIDTEKNNLHSNCRFISKYNESELSVYIDPKTMQPFESNTNTFKKGDGTIITGSFRVIKQGEIFYRWVREKAPEGQSLGMSIEINPKTFSGFYRLVGETSVKNRVTGKNENFQISFPKIKISSEASLNLTPDGDPTVFNLSCTVLKSKDGPMMNMVKYKTTSESFDGNMSGSTKTLPTGEVMPENPSQGFSWFELENYFKEIIGTEILSSNLEILSPPNNTTYKIGDAIYPSDEINYDKFMIVVGYKEISIEEYRLIKLVNGELSEPPIYFNEGEIFKKLINTERILSTDEYEINIVEN